LKTIGIDIGSYVTKIVILDGKKVLHREAAISADGSEVTAQKAINRALAACNVSRRDIDSIVATGLAKRRFSFVNDEKSSFMCLWRGAAELLPDVRTIIDVGAEDTIVVGIDHEGRIKDFANNDKCAAGSGLFVDMLAHLMGVSIEEMTSEALAADKEVAFNNQCVLFVEQEVISYSCDTPPPSRGEIFAGLFSALSSRVMGLVRKVGIVPPVLLCGGLSKNKAFVKRLEELIKTKIYIPTEPQFVSALGAALFGMNAVMVHFFDPHPSL
jgi:(R)-2-hydroxyacyl-CoA dehydratese activating ATPase